MRKALILSLLLAACSPQSQDQIARSAAKSTVSRVVAEQFPKGGALTLNAISGIGMLGVGVVGGALIGEMQEVSAREALQKEQPGVYETINKRDTYLLGSYQAIDGGKQAADLGVNEGDTGVVGENAFAGLYFRRSEIGPLGG